MNMVTTEVPESSYRSAETDELDTNSFSSLKKTMRVTDENTLMPALRELVSGNLDTELNRVFLKDLGINVSGKEEKYITVMNHTKQGLIKLMNLPKIGEDQES